MKVGVIQSRIVVGDLDGNARRLADGYQKAVAEGAEIVVAPEDAIAGYCEGDQRLYPSFLRRHDEALLQLLRAVGDVPLILGITEKNPCVGKPLRNSAVFIQGGKIVPASPKPTLPPKPGSTASHGTNPNAKP